MSLFDSGQIRAESRLHQMLVNSLVGIKAKPGWLIVVAAIPITPAPATEPDAFAETCRGGARLDA
jgi:hypothetical protein